jgi:hypothetical protein
MLGLNYLVLACRRFPSQDQDNPQLKPETLDRSSRSGASPGPPALVDIEALALPEAGEFFRKAFSGVEATRLNLAAKLRAPGPPDGYRPFDDLTPQAYHRTQECVK